MYSTIERGTLNTADYRLYLRDDKGPISPMHDIPLWADSEQYIFNMVIEVPRWTNPKMEMRTGEPLNPIMQEVQDGHLRFMPNVFPHHGCIWNYGSLPQTWESPNVSDASTGQAGDNDPLDVMEIGFKVGRIGEVRRVKVLGSIAMIDQGETDWKVFCIDISDPMAESLRDISDMDKHFNGLYDATVNWLRVYKLFYGKPENKFAFGGQPKGKNFTIDVINNLHEQWKSLVHGKEKAKTKGKVECVNTTVANSPFRISAKKAEELVAKSPFPSDPEPLDPVANNWFFSDTIRKRRKSNSMSRT